MSDCGVCLYSGCDFDGNGFEKSTQSFKTAMQCCECEKRIAPGVEHEKATWRDDDGKLQTAHTCPVCAEIAWAFFCGSRLYNCLWDYLSDVREELTTTCFDKLQTSEAKAELRRRWMSWKGLTA